MILVAPHATPGDDVNTDLLTEHMREEIGCFAVINHGWKRADNYSYDAEQADCNNVHHMVDVVRDEFLDPIKRLKSEILKKHGVCHIFFIHGMSNKQEADIVLGCGMGSPNSFSCEPWRTNLLVTLLDAQGVSMATGKSGGKYSGWASTNMNQYFRKHDYDPRVQSMQVEIVRDLREDQGITELTAEYLASAIKSYLRYDKFDNLVRTKEL